MDTYVEGVGCTYLHVSILTWERVQLPGETPPDVVRNCLQWWVGGWLVLVAQCSWHTLTSGGWLSNILLLHVMDGEMDNFMVLGFLSSIF